MKAWEIVGWTGDAEVWCIECAEDHFDFKTDSRGDLYATDREGNDVHPIFASDEIAEMESCGHCGAALLD